MACSACGQAIPDGAKFCPECGTPAAASCAGCGATLPASARFCMECGAPVAGRAPADQAERTAAADRTGGIAAPVAERRLISVLFADLVGFTTIAEGRDAEAVRDLLSRYFDLCQEIIARYGGTVEKFIGDAVMAVWGAPVTRENDAERAVRAALDLVSAVRILGPEVQARAAVMTGEAAVTLGATNQGMVAGDLVNTASRLQGVAPPGTVLVGETTVRAADSAIAFEPAGEQLLKGKESPVPSHRAVRVIAERGGKGRQGGLEAPFVGRDDEFRLLRDLVHATSREHRPRLISITGQAGVGKSRMTWELSKYLDGVVESIWWHAGRSPAYGEGVVFWALGEMVRTRAGLAETDDEGTTRARIEATVDRWVPDPAERRWIERALLALLGVESDVAMPRDELFSAWRTFFERIAAEGTVVLVFEDLHWADQGLLEFIDHILDWAKSSPIAVICLARPDLLEWRPDWGAGRRNFVGIALEPLPSEAMGELLAGLVPGLPAGAADRIVTRADGIPLYAVETVRMLVTTGSITEDEGTYRPVGDLSELAVPETLQALVAARLDALDPTDRSVIQDAAVLGQSFTVAALEAVSGVPATTLQDPLRTLVRRELLVHLADPASPERGQYAFVQALVREVAYGTLARRDRRTRHLAAARYFEGLGEDELAGALATHYLAAYRASADDPEALALANQARLALRGAAERSQALGGLEQAAAYFLEAIEVTDEPSGIADLLERAGVAADTGGRSEIAVEHLRDARDRYAELGDRPAEARVSGLLGRAVINGSRSTEAVPILKEATERFADLVDDPSLAMVEHEYARALWFTDERGLALALTDRALVRGERLGASALVADALITKGGIMGEHGRPLEGLGIMRAGIELADANGLIETAVRGRLNLGASLMDRDPRGSFESCRQTMDVSRRYGLRSSLAIAAGNTAEIAFRLGEWDWIEREIGGLLEDKLQANDRRALMRGIIETRAARGVAVADLLEEHSAAIGGDATDESNHRGARAAVAFAAGDFRAAIADWEVGAAMNPLNSMTDLPRAAMAAALVGDTDHVRDVLGRIDAHGALGQPARVGRAAAAAAADALDGRTADAVAGFAEALVGARDMGLVSDQVTTAMLMARTLPDEPTTHDAIANARALVDALGAVAWQTILDGLGPSEPEPAIDRAGPGASRQEAPARST